jgi:hypothetical protein
MITRKKRQKRCQNARHYLEDSAMKKIMLKDLQNVLPLGYFTPEGNLVKSFKNRPWRMIEERAVGEIREKQKTPMMGPFISELLAYMITGFDGMDFEAKTPAERRLMLNQMSFPDVIYMYVWLRREAVGPELLLKSTCPICSYMYDIECDLDEMEIEVPDENATSPDDFKKPVQLKKGLEIDGATYHEMIIKPASWMVMEGMTAKLSSNDGALKTKFFQDCLVEIPGYTAMDHFVVTDTLLDNMMKVDIELLNKAIDDASGGLNMNIEAKCEQCNGAYKQGIDWNYDNFFSASSIPSPTQS